MNVELNQTQSPASGADAHSPPACASDHPRLDDPDPVVAQRAWEIGWKAQCENDAARQKEEALDLERSVELAKMIDHGELHPGLLFNDRFELHCLRPLSGWIAEGIEAVANQRYLPYAAMTPEDKAVVQSAIEKIRAFQTAGKPMTEVEDDAVVKPVSIDTEIMESIHRASQIVAGELHPASVIDTEGEVQGPEAFRAWMKPGAKIDAHRLISPEVRAVIESAERRIFAVRCRKHFRTAEEDTAQQCLEHRKRETQLEDALARMGTAHQMARYRAGLLKLYDEALPLLIEETFSPLRPLNLSPYQEFTPEDVLTGVFGAGRFDPVFANPEDWLEGRAIMTDEPTEAERILMGRIRAKLPRCEIVIYQRRLGLEGGDGQMLFYRCRNRIEVKMPAEGRKVSKSFLSPRGDY